MGRSCFSESDVVAFWRGELAGAALDELQAHADVCAPCRTFLSAAVDDRAGDDPYEVIREVARGGMGVIFEAWDRRHDRTVAIKTLEETDPSWVARFHREIKITAQLQHPSIIALYEAGRWRTGEPYYAMRLVEGTSLAVAARRATTPRARLALLPHLIALSEALAYAHEKGVIHRDLKPSNVLVGNFGETVVIDWGLAKRLDEPAPPLPEQRGADGPLTRAGAIVGTPAFMAPEQARGGMVDARADVHALGAIAYQVLTGRPPHEADASLEEVLATPPPPIDELAPQLPADLRAIVSKAMAREPGARYPSALALAADLNAFATGRLVSAMSYSRWTLLRRWVARHRAPIALGLVSLAALAIALVTTVTRIVRERDRADAARDVALRSQLAAETLVDYLLRQLRGKLEEVGRLDLMSGLGDEIERYYQQVSVPEGTARAAALVRRGDALGLLGNAEQAAGLVASSMARAERSRALYEEAVLADPANEDAHKGVCGAWSRLGDLERGRARPAEAERHFGTAVACARQNLARRPQDPRAHRNLAVQLWRLGTLHFDRGQWDGARARYLEGRELLSAAAALGERHLSDETWVANQLASLARRSGNFVEALAEQERAVAGNRALVAEAPDDSGRRLALAGVLETQVRLEMDLGNWPAALRHIEESIGILEALVAREPRNIDWQWALGDHVADRCDIHRQRYELDEARPWCQRAMALGRALAAQAPGRQEFIGAAGTAAWLAGHLALLEGDLAAARAFAGEAAARAEDQRKLAPTAVFARKHALMASELLGHVELAARRGAEARRAFRGGVADAEAIVAETKSSLHRQELAELTLWLGDAEALAGDRAAARAHHERAHTMIVEQARLFPQRVPLTTLLARSMLRVAAYQPDPRALRAEAKAALEQLGERIDGGGRELLRGLAE